jgi:phenylacetate-CoA ligase
MIILGGEVFDKNLKKLVEDDLDAEWFDSYGAYECGQIGWECTHHEGLHVNSDYVYVEYLPPENSSEEVNARTVTITNLFAFAQPFIRYKLGDLCVPSNKRCSCGRGLPLIDHLIGREDDLVKLPSGRIMTPNIFHYVLAGRTDVEQWRVVQESEDRVVLKLVMPERPDGELLDSLRSKCLEYLGEPVRIDIELVDFMEEETAKFRTFISNVPG